MVQLPVPSYHWHLGEMGVLVKARGPLIAQQAAAARRKPPRPPACPDSFNVQFAHQHSSTSYI